MLCYAMTRASPERSRRSISRTLSVGASHQRPYLPYEEGARFFGQEVLGFWSRVAHAIECTPCTQ